MFRSKSRLATVAICVLSVIGSVSSGVADEGMWLFNDIPVQQLKAQYGFEPTQDWAARLMKASVRFNVGGSASFVSSNGLVLTNHHVGSDTIQKLSTAERDYYRDGFLAQSYDQEMPAPDLELNQLVAIQDVTDQVNDAVKPEMSPAEAGAARRAVMANIEKQATDDTGLRCDVITLFGGGRYHLYQFKRYTDVRLVWAPEEAAAFFGGDADNFEYPRYCLDACLFRVYEDGEPARIEHFLKWSDGELQEGELILVSGNPGSTSRIFTLDALKHDRDVRLPHVLNLIRRREILLQQLGLEGAEQQRIAKDDLLGIQNARKLYNGMLQGLQDPVNMQLKQHQEQQLLDRIQADPKLAGYYDAWRKVAEAQKKWAALQEKSFSLNTRLVNDAMDLVWLASEEEKPNDERLEEFRDSARSSLMQQLLSPAPVHRQLEQVKLADLLAQLVEKRGADDPLVQNILDGKSPIARASELVGGTSLHDVEHRRQLAEGGQSAIENSSDPMIQFARLLDQPLREFRQSSDQIDEIERQAYAQIAEALFAVAGTSTYPDATFSLRLAIGVIRGYQEDGRAIPAWTTVAGAFAHQQAHHSTEPWVLPASWDAARGRLNLQTPLDFVCTADITGGNSGSPVVNRNLELVGLIFDGNIQSLPNDYFYSEVQGRAIAVSGSAIREALRQIYNAGQLADQLGH